MPITPRATPDSRSETPRKTGLMELLASGKMNPILGHPRVWVRLPARTSPWPMIPSPPFSWRASPCLALTYKPILRLDSSGLG